MRFDNASTVVYYCLIQMNIMNIINLGILAHIDAGKTSVTENLLFASGATEKCGCVDNGDTITDSMDIEKRRGITVRASTTSIISVSYTHLDVYKRQVCSYPCSTSGG